MVLGTALTSIEADGARKSPRPVAGRDLKADPTAAILQQLGRPFAVGAHL